MVDEQALREAVVAYVRSTAGAYELGTALYRVTDHGLQVLACDGAGVSVADPDGRLRFVTASEQRVVHIEEEQSIQQDGPCFEAYESGRIVTTRDLEAEDRWPDYRPTALQAGFRSVAGIPMSVEGRRVGAMNLYHASPHDWSPAELDAASLLADMASGYIANHRMFTAQQELTDQLEKALETRVVIEQAKGAVAAEHGIDVSEAFDRLRSHARQRRLRLHDVASDVVERRLRL